MITLRSTFIPWLTLVFIGLFTQTLQAQTLEKNPTEQLSSAQNTEQQAFELSIAVQALLLRYYHIQADEENAELADQLQRQLSEAENDYQQLNWQLNQPHQSATSAFGQDGFQQDKFTRQSAIRQHWQAFNQHLNSNLQEIRDNAFPELQLVAYMREAAHSMSQELLLLAADLRQHYEMQLSPIQQWSRAQAQALQHVVERYLERAASSMGVPLVVYQQPLSADIAKFSNGLSQGLKMNLNKSALTKIRSQWLFIEKAASRSNADLVPYLVMRYCDNIIRRLLQLNAN